VSRIYKWCNGLSKQVRDSITISVTIVAITSAIMSIFGVSLGSYEKLSIWFRFCVVAFYFFIIYITAYIAIGKIFGNLINLTIRKTSVSVGCGDIFEAPGLRIIGCDTHFDTRVDDIIISKKSLHGQLFLKHGKKEEIDMAVNAEASRLKLHKNNDGMYDFPLGTIIRYDSSVDNHTYLMLAMAELNPHHETHTNMAKFGLMLMKMWKEIDRVYANHDVALPLLGTGISRFDDGPKDKQNLLRCMLCTLNISGVSLNSKVAILIYGDTKDIPLYEYKDIFHTIPGR